MSGDISKRSRHSVCRRSPKLPRPEYGGTRLLSLLQMARYQSFSTRGAAAEAGEALRSLARWARLGEQVWQFGLHNFRVI